MPRIRPNSTVRFKDTSGTLLYSTGSDVYLSALDEKTPAVKTITVNVPARDGVLDLTESVAGRPLYGNRSIVITLSILKADHPSAVAEVRAMRRAIHGQMCRVETPDNIIPDSSTTTPGATIQGWYLGRVSIGEVKYPGEAAVVKITVDAQPWIYYSNVTETLAHSAPTTYTDGALATADRSRYADMVIEVAEPSGTVWDSELPYDDINHVPQRIALVASKNANLMLYGTMCRWQTWSKTHASGDTFDMGWSRDDTVIEVDNGTGQLMYKNANTLTATRALITHVNDYGDETGMLVTDMTDRITIYVEAFISTTGYTTEGVAPGLRFFVQGCSLPDSPEDATGGIMAGGGAVAYQAMTPDQYGMVSASYTIDPASVVPNLSGNASGFIVAGVEATWVKVTSLNARVKLHKAGANASSAVPNSTTAIIDLPEPLYSNASKRNVATITPYGNSMTVALRVPEGSSTASAVTPAETVQVGSVALEGTPMYVRAYGVTTMGWKPLASTITLYPWATATIDTGDIPTTFTASIGSPTAFSKDGSKAIMTDSGPLPFALSGTAATLDYMVMGSTDSTLTYDMGTV